jgi:hypothetical membrane protein
MELGLLEYKVANVNDIFSHAFLLLGFIAVAGDFIIPAIISKRYPDYSQLHDTISTLGTNKSPVKKQTSIWLISLGFLLICFGIGQCLKFVDYSWKHLLYTWGILAYGVGAGIIAGIFPEDPKGIEETLSGKVHGISAGLGFIFLLINPLLALGIDEFNGLEWFNIGFFVVGLITFILFLMSEKNEKGIFALSGLWQRLNLLALYSPLLLNYAATEST